MWQCLPFQDSRLPYLLYETTHCHNWPGGMMLAVRALLQAAYAHHREGRQAEAAAIYRQVLEISPEEVNALSFLGAILLAGGQLDDAEALFEKLRSIQPRDAFALHNLGRIRQARDRDREAVDLFAEAVRAKNDLAPIFNDLAVSLNRLGRREEALAALDQALAIDPGFGVAYDNRGLVLSASLRYADAMAAHLMALRHLPADATDRQRLSILLHLAESAYDATDLVMAERACLAMLEFDESNEEAMVHLAKVLMRAHRDNEAIAHLNRLARIQGLSRKGELAAPAATILLLGAVGANHVPTRYLFDPSEFNTISLTLVSPDQPDAPLGGFSFDDLREADLVFNTVGDPDRDGGQRTPVSEVLDRLAKPVFNPPERVWRTGRDQATVLFGDIPGLVVPAVRSVSRQALLGSPMSAAPFLLRPAGAHGGEDLSLIESREALGAYLDSVTYQRFLMTEFHDFRGARNAYRKYRFIFVDRKPYPYHLALGDHWLVHYWRADMIVSDWKKQEEEAFLTDWRRLFGARASVIEAIAERLDLDYGGLDCSILPGGDVLFFEANACMLMHLDESAAEFPYKHRVLPGIREAVTRMVKARFPERIKR